ncbi:hypothetical protein DPMN_107846 [Dreissena polymorpha]|uniref:Uncharacterized protein n=1 Tax=Dreissena polymorpha TaxID=45954 RepID=A0A9D4K7J0_DREPO|nr:hypothetical protein DPMN_107846 [Dreissena polymorpha]
MNRILSGLARSRCDIRTRPSASFRADPHRTSMRNGSSEDLSKTAALWIFQTLPNFLG